MSVIFEDTVNHGVRVRYSQTPLSNIPLDDLRLIIQDLNNVSHTLGCVVFEGNGESNTDLIIFAGNLERFSMLSAARSVGSRVFYFQDTISWWYGGSEILPDISGIASFLREHVTGRRSVVFGQSSGGYAALAIGGFIADSDVLACSPQTFPDAGLKRKLHVSPSLAVQYAPDYLLDMEEHYASCSRAGLTAAIFAASEFNNPYQSHFWMDHLHLAKLSRVPSIDIFIAAAANHSIVFRRAAAFSDCLQRLLQRAEESLEIKRSIVSELVLGIQELEAVEG